MILAEPAAYEYFYEWKAGFFHSSQMVYQHVEDPESLPFGAYFVEEGHIIISFDVPKGVYDPDFKMYSWIAEDSDAEVMRVSVPAPTWLDCIGVNRV